MHSNSMTTSLRLILRSGIAESKGIVLKAFAKCCQTALLICCANLQTHWLYKNAHFANPGFAATKQAPKPCQLDKLMRLSFILQLVSYTPQWDPSGQLKLCHENTFCATAPDVYISYYLSPQHHQIFI